MCDAIWFVLAVMQSAATVMQVREAFIMVGEIKSAKRSIALNTEEALKRAIILQEMQDASGC